MNDDQIFEALVRDEFAFLERELGFVHEGAEVQLPDVWSTFRKGETSIVITLEMGGTPWVTIGFPDPSSEPHAQTVKVSLPALLAVEAPDVQLPGFPVAWVDDPSLREALHENAVALQRNGMPFLMGDKFIRIRAQEKQREIIDQRSRELYGALAKSPAEET